MRRVAGEMPVEDLDLGSRESACQPIEAGERKLPAQHTHHGLERHRNSLSQPYLCLAKIHLTEILVTENDVVVKQTIHLAARQLGGGQLDGYRSKLWPARYSILPYPVYLRKPAITTDILGIPARVDDVLD